MTRIDLLTNPMTTEGDIIVAGSAGVPEAVAAGSEDDVLTIVSGVPEWAAAPGGGSFMGARCYHSTTQTIATGGFAAVTFDTEEFDTDAIHAGGAPTRFTVPTGGGGKWMGNGGVTWDTNATNNRYLLWRVNGTTFVRGGQAWTLGSGSSPGLNAPFGPIALADADYLELMVFQDSGGDRTIGSAATLYKMSAASVWRVG